MQTVCKKGIRWSVLFALALALVFGAHAQTVQADIIDVCETGCPHTSINGAIAAAQPGDTIKVGPGTYNENLTITKSITLEGPNVGIDPNNGTGRDDEAIINGGNSIAIRPEASNIKIDGFTITSTKEGFPIYTSETGVAGLTIQNNIINNGVRAVTVTGTGTDVKISNNKIDGDIYSIVITGGNITNLTIEANNIGAGTTNTIYSSGSTDGFALKNNVIEGKCNIASHINNGTIEGNTFTVNAPATSHVNLNVHNSTVQDNTFIGFENTGGLRLWGTEYDLNPSENTTIRNNTFDNTEYGVKIGPGNRSISIANNTYITQVATLGR